MQTALAYFLPRLSLLQADNGIAAIEYAMIAAALALVVLGAAPELGAIVTTYFADVQADIWPTP